MLLESLDAFREWASSNKIEVKKRTLSKKQVSHTLRFRTSTAQDRYWSTPAEVKELLVFISTLLDAVSAWEFCWVLKREGRWDDRGDDEGLEPLLRDLGIPVGFEGVLRFGRDERSLLTLLLVSQIAFGWCGYYDVLVIPSHGRQVIQTDDDGITAALFKDGPALETSVAAMSQAGFELAESPPGFGFFWQPWMEAPQPAGGA